MSFTLGTLETAIKEYLDSTESTFTSNLSNFIQSTEERILKSVDLPVFRKNMTGTSASGNTYLGRPSDFLSPYSLAVISGSNYSYLWFKHVTFIRDYTPVDIAKSRKARGLPFGLESISILGGAA